jgi:hypothetical protein
MTRSANTIFAALYLIVLGGIFVIALGGAFVAFCHSFGFDAKTVGYWVLMGWLVTAVIVLGTAIIVPVWEKAGQSSQTSKRKRVPFARTIAGTHVTAHGEH